MTRTDGQTCADATVGAIVVHRLIEGMALAAAYVIGSAIGVVEAVVLAAHGTAECIAVGGSYGGSGRRRVLFAVAAVQDVFLGGAGIGLLVTDGLPDLIRAGVLGLVGGALLVMGLDESFDRH